MLYYLSLCFDYSNGFALHEGWEKIDHGCTTKSKTANCRIGGFFHKEEMIN
jgi:hypothetical protein